MNACHSHREGSVCADGFIQKPICRGVFGCHECGSVSGASTPNCQSEKPGTPHFNEDGSPRYYATPAKATEARRAETGTGSVHDGAVPQAFAQNITRGESA